MEKSATSSVPLHHLVGAGKMLKTRDTAKPALTSTSFSCYTFFSFKNIFFKTIVAEICEILRIFKK